MQVLINDESVDLTTEEKPALGDVVAQAEKFASEHGKVITQITVNGELITAEDENLRRFDECQSSDEINMLMDSPRNIIVAALEEADNDIPRIVENLKNVAAHLQTGSRRAAFSLFSQCIEQWKQVINLFRIAESVIGVDTKELVIEGRTLDNVQTELLELLVETKKSMQEDDAVTLSDLLEYELAPNVEQQRDIIRHLISAANESCPAEE